MESRSKALRKALESPGMVLAVGAFDALSARIAERLGFRAVITGGYTTSASLLGKPDWGLLTQTEMVRHIGYVAEACNLPLIADADTGYGNPINVRRTGREFEKAGVAAIFLEDQVHPKRCGHMEGKQVIPAEEHAQKIRAAVDARTDDDLVIIARTDARSVYDLDEAIRRCRLYREAGADVTFVEAPRSVEELRRIVREIDAPQVANMIEGGRTPFLNAGELENMGFKIAFYTLGVYYAVAKTVYDFMSCLKSTGTTEGFSDRMFSFDEFNELVGLHEMQELEREYR